MADLVTAILQGLGQGGMDVVQQRRRERQAAKEEERWFERMDYQQAQQESFWQKQEKARMETLKEQRVYQEGRDTANFERQKQFAQYQSNIRMNEQRQTTALDYATKLKAFRQQALFNNGLEGIRAEGQKQQEFERYARMDTKSLAMEVAKRQAQGFPKENQNQVIQYTLKQLNGKNKVFLLDALGQTQADYSQWQNDPQFKDAIPSVKPIGLDSEEFDMNSMFQMNYKEQEDFMTKALTGLSDYSKAQMQEYRMVKSKVVSGVPGVTDISPDAARIISASAGKGAALKDGVDAHIMAATTYLEGGSGLLVKLDDGTIVTRQEAEGLAQLGNDREQMANRGSEISGLPNYLMAPGVEPQGQPTAPKGQMDTAREQQAFTQESKYKMPAIEKDVKDYNTKLEKSKNPHMGVTAMNKIEKGLEGLSPEAMDYLWGTKGLLNSVTTGITGVDNLVTTLAAKADDPAAVEAAAFLSLVSQETGKLRHEQFGSAQTATEMAQWQKQMKDPGFWSSPDVLREQIGVKKSQLADQLKLLGSNMNFEDKVLFNLQNPDLDIWDSFDINVSDEDKASFRDYMQKGGDPYRIIKYLDEQRRK